MTYVLLLYVLYSGQLAVTTADFADKEACEKALLVAQLGHPASMKDVTGFCIPNSSR